MDPPEMSDCDHRLPTSLIFAEPTNKRRRIQLIHRPDPPGESASQLHQSIILKRKQAEKLVGNTVGSEPPSEFAVGKVIQAMVLDGYSHPSFQHNRISVDPPGCSGESIIMGRSSEVSSSNVVTTLPIPDLLPTLKGPVYNIDYDACNDSALEMVKHTTKKNDRPSVINGSVLPHYVFILEYMRKDYLDLQKTFRDRLLEHGPLDTKRLNYCERLYVIEQWVDCWQITSFNRLDMPHYQVEAKSIYETTLPKNLKQIIVNREYHDERVWSKRLDCDLIPTEKLATLIKFMKRASDSGKKRENNKRQQTHMDLGASTSANSRRGKLSTIPQYMPGPSMLKHSNAEEVNWLFETVSACIADHGVPCLEGLDLEYAL